MWRTVCHKCRAPCPSSGGDGSSWRLSGGRGGSYNCGSGDYGSGRGGGFKRDRGDSGPREELRSSSTFVMQEGTGAQSNPMAAEVSTLKDIAAQPDSSLDECLNGWPRSYFEEWVKVAESIDDFDDLPPLEIVLFPDLVARGWGWERLVPFDPSKVKLSQYKIYLGHYLEENGQKVAVLSGKEQPESNKDGIAAEFLNAKANQCLEIEKKLLHDLTVQDTNLSKEISVHISRMSRSKGGSFAEVAALMCIMKEAKLMCLSLECEFKTEEIITVSNKVRSSALNLMGYKGDKSDALAATAAMVGLIVEAENLCDRLTQRDPDTDETYVFSRMIRNGTARFLTTLENENTRRAACNDNDKLKGVNGFSDTNFEEYDSTENSRKVMNRHFENDNKTKVGKKMENFLDNQAGRKLSKRKLKKAKKRSE